MTSVIEIRDLGKCYNIYDKPMDLVLDLLKLKKAHKKHWALQGVDLSIQKGEVVGVLGVNGAGKSTLLKILSGKLEKTTGTYAIQGRVSSILELGTGFHPHYTGRENILMGAMCLGLSREEALAKINWIIDFSGLADVIDQPFNTYSSGMQARLTFATAVSIEPDIFIVDEALATGDAFFAQKCLNRIREICQNGATALFVSHATHAIVQLCSRAIWIDKGRVRMDGPALEVVRAYEYHGHALMNAAGSAVAVEVSDLSTEKKIKTAYRRGPYVIEKVELLNRAGEAVNQFFFWDLLRLRVTYSCPEDAPVEPIGVVASVNRRDDFLLAMNFNSHLPHSDEEALGAEPQPFRTVALRHGVIEAEVSPLQLTPGHYFLSVGILKNCPSSVDYYEYRHFFYDLVVLRSGYPESSVFYPMVTWTHEAVREPILA